MSRRSKRGDTWHRRLFQEQKKSTIRNLGLTIGQQRKLLYDKEILEGASSVLEKVSFWKENLRYYGPFPKKLSFPYLLRCVSVSVVLDPSRENYSVESFFGQEEGHTVTIDASPQKYPVSFGDSSS